MPGCSRIPSTTSRPPLTRFTTPGGSSERVELLERDLLRQRHLLGGLEHERVAAGDRERQEPERDHRGEVERHDRGADADRLPDRLRVDVARDVLEVPALHRRRDRTRGPTISIIRATSARASAIVLPISVVTDRANSSCGHQALAQLEQPPRAFDHADPRATAAARRARRRPPRPDRAPGERDAGDHLTGRGVRHVEPRRSTPASSRRRRSRRARGPVSWSRGQNRTSRAGGRARSMPRVRP